MALQHAQHFIHNTSEKVSTGFSPFTVKYTTCCNVRGCCSTVKIQQFKTDLLYRGFTQLWLLLIAISLWTKEFYCKGVFQSLLPLFILYASEKQPIHPLYPLILCPVFIGCSHTETESKKIQVVINTKSASCNLLSHVITSIWQITTIMPLSCLSLMIKKLMISLVC